jgi:hypothetical protein
MNTNKKSRTPKRTAGAKEQRAGDGRPETTDLLRTAYDREREHRWRPRRPLEMEATWLHVFRCACCERVRREEYRREPASAVCTFCVQAAGQPV